MKVALIASGKIAIPPPGWGAVEIIIWKHAQTLRERGHEVVIYNTTDLAGVARDINGTKYDFVHLHHDEYIRFFTKHLQKPFCATSHYGYINKPGKWARGYYAVYADFFKAPGVIALSDEIANSYRQKGYGGFLRTLHNGTSVRDFHFKPNGGNGRALCLGKIEPRKRQAWLAEKLDGVANIDFAGPMADPAFMPGKTCRYLGPWTRAQVLEHLTDYSALIHLSDGEVAAPLVVLEALAAGLSVVVSKAASDAMSENAEESAFIKVFPDDFNDPQMLAQILHTTILENAPLRRRIRDFAQAHFDYDKIVEDYIAIMESFLLFDPNKQTYSPMRGINWYRYWNSRVWFLLSQAALLRMIRQWLKQKKPSV